ncbi:MAG TPA: S8 family serine peptidase [Candidatus Binatia bacterium]|jgi:subtilisin family serine protease
MRGAKLTALLVCSWILATASAASAGRAIVTLPPGTDVQAAANQATASGAVITHIFHEGYSGKLPGALIKQLRGGPGVTVEHDRKVQLAQIVCVTQSAVPSWGLDRLSERAITLDGEYQYEFTGAAVNVYVIDTGIDTTNSDLGGRASWGADEIDGTDQDCNGHGTAVAGTIGGTTYGVAKQVSLIAVRALNCKGIGFASDVVAGLEWATDNYLASPKPSVIVLSLAGKLNNALNAAVDAATAAGITTVAAAGNRHADACKYSPASATSVMTAAATDNTDVVDLKDHIAPFSNGGTCVSFFAPGVGIDTDGLLGSIVSVSGTSISAAFLGGVAAQVLDEHHTWTPAQVKAHLVDKSTKGVVVGPTKAPDSPNQVLYSACDV